ncbi:hypothetical protein ACFLTD_00860 [Elusimicrobiota bacterium]
MKINKYILAVTALLMLCSGYIVIKQRSILNKRRSLLSCVPVKFSDRDNIFIFGIKNAPRLCNTMRKTRFFQVMKKSQYFPRIERSIIKTGIYNNDKVDQIIDMSVRDIIIAFYKNSNETVSFAIIANVCRLKKLIELLDELYLSENKKEADTYNGLRIYRSANNHAVCIYKGIFIVSNETVLLEKIVDLKKGLTPEVSFDTVYPWVLKGIQRSSDMFLFTSNNIMAKYIAEFIKKYFDMDVRERVLISHTLHEIILDRGIYINSYSRDPAARKSAASFPLSIAFLPEKIILGGASVDMNIPSWILDYISRYTESSIDKSVIEETVKDSSYAILGPSVENINSVLPRCIYTFQAGNEILRTRIQEHLQKIFNTDFRKEIFNNIEYSFTELFFHVFKKIQICITKMDLKGKIFIIFTTSREVMEDVIRDCYGMGRFFIDTPVWKEYKKFFPKYFSSFVYADVNALIRTVGMFIADMSEEEKYVNFLDSDPFSWIGSVGSVTVYKEGYVDVHTYIPMQELSVDKWRDLINGFVRLLNEYEK